ncbi:MAG: hypothetical protein IPH54_16410 [Rhodoferax sp.]|nr:hypothetical protein [Rhodoferax sp.]
MENKSHALAAGASVLAMLALFDWIGRMADTRQPCIAGVRTSSPEAVTGLQPQASVRYKGR